MQFYNAFSEFRNPVQKCVDRIQGILNELPGTPSMDEMQFREIEDVREWMVGLLDETLERVDVALVDLKRAAEVKKESSEKRSEQDSKTPLPTSVDGASIATKIRGYVSYMRSTMKEKPQQKFIDSIDNSNSTWVPKLDSLKGIIDVEIAKNRTAEAISKGEPKPHPLEEWLDSLTYPETQLDAPEQPHEYGSFEETPFCFVDTLPGIKEVAKRLAKEKEIAVDLEAHNYRSYQGFCCLMQVSTRHEDIIIDVLKLREHVGPVLAPIFANPAIVKVLHGSDGDIVWLQRDFGIFTINLFDTGQAMRLLNYPAHGLGYLLEKMCGFKADKRWQLADWRLRPLDPEALHYARADTHFLLYCYDRLKQELKDLKFSTVENFLMVPLPSSSPENGIGLALERSRRLCLLQYEKELLKEDSFLLHYHRGCGKEGTLNDERLSVFAALYEWRDQVAREEDESLGYILSRRIMWEIARSLPITEYELSRAVGKSAPAIQRRSKQVLQLIQESRKPDRIARVSAIKKEWINSKEGKAFSQKQQPNYGQLRDLQVAAEAAMISNVHETNETNDNSFTINRENGTKNSDFSTSEAHENSPANEKQSKDLLQKADQRVDVSIEMLTTEKFQDHKLRAKRIKDISTGDDKFGCSNLSLISSDFKSDTSISGTFSNRRKVVLPLATGSQVSSLGAVFSHKEKNSKSGKAISNIHERFPSKDQNEDSHATAIQVRASFSLDFHSSTLQMSTSSPGVEEGKKANDKEGIENIDSSNAKHLPRNQRQEVRDAMTQLKQEQMKEDEALGSKSDVVPEEDTGKSPFHDEEPEHYLPLSISEKYNISKRIGKKRRKENKSVSGGIHAEVRRRLRETGLEDSDNDAEEALKKSRKEEAVSVPAVDYQSAASKYDLGIVNPHERKAKLKNEKKGRKGMGKRGGASFGSSSTKRSKSTSGTNNSSSRPRFSPYTIDLAGLKKGKRSSVHVRSGSKSMSFRR